jgi:hypothetical protein
MLRPPSASRVGVQRLCLRICSAAPSGRHLDVAFASPGNANLPIGAFVVAVVGAQHAVPGKHAWLPVRHLPRVHGRSCGMRELVHPEPRRAPAVRRPGLPGRAPRINRGTPTCPAQPRDLPIGAFVVAVVGAQHAVPGKHAWLPVHHPPRALDAGATCPGLNRGSPVGAFDSALRSIYTLSLSKNERTA